MPDIRTDASPRTVPNFFDAKEDSALPKKK